MPSDRESSRHGVPRESSRDDESRDGNGKGKGKERRHSHSRSSDDSDDEPDEFIPEKHHHDRARTKNMRREISHWYVDKDASQAERKWSLNKRSGKYSNNPHDLEDREKTAKGNRAAVRDLDRHGVEHRDFAYAESSPGHRRSDQRYANDDHLCREPDSYAAGPRYRWVPMTEKPESRHVRDGRS